MAIKESISRRVFVVCNAVVLILLAVMALFPFVNVIASSFATSLELTMRPFMLFPYNPTIQAYRYIFSTNTFINALRNSVFVTVIGTIINLTMTYLMAYPLSHKTLVGRRKLMNLIVFTMLFSGGMVPAYLNLKQLGMIDTYWALWLPGAISTFNLIVMKNFIQQIPDELKEAARIDGANELYILIRVILPLSLPVLATFCLFYAVSLWNSYFDCMLYINTSSKWTVQVLLRQIILTAQGLGDQDAMGHSARAIIPSEAVKNAAVLVATLPILIVYPFLQKYFAKGALLGSVKG